jgi:predicted nucleic acid-binding protein
LPEFICNTSPLQYLHQLGWLEILPALTGRVIIPPAVADELDRRRFRVSSATRLAVLKLAGEVTG